MLTTSSLFVSGWLDGGCWLLAVPVDTFGGSHLRARACLMGGMGRREGGEVRRGRRRRRRRRRSWAGATSVTRPESVTDWRITSRNDAVISPITTAATAAPHGGVSNQADFHQLEYRRLMNCNHLLPLSLLLSPPSPHQFIYANTVCVCTHTHARALWRVYICARFKRSLLTFRK